MQRTNFVNQTVSGVSFVKYTVEVIQLFEAHASLFADQIFFAQFLRVDAEIPGDAPLLFPVDPDVAWRAAAAAAAFKTGEPKSALRLPPVFLCPFSDCH